MIEISHLRRQIEASLGKVLRKKRPVTLYEPARYLMQGGGKRIRSVVTLLCAAAVGGRIDHAISAATAVELLHNFSLVHDDIMDRDELRRGRPTVHTKWDTNIAILTGDLMAALAVQSLSALPPRTLAAVLPVFTRGYIELCEGQALDKEFENRKNVSESDYLDMIAGKTAALFATAAEIGALAGGGKPATVKRLRTFGHGIGMAFQIQDDFLDIVGHERTLGKDVGSDLIEHKKTILSLAAARHPEGRRLMKRFRADNSARQHADALRQFRDFLMKSGIATRTERHIATYLAKARQALRPLPDGIARRQLLAMVTLMEGRRR